MFPHTYSDELKVKDALQIYFSAYHFRDGGYHLKWFRIKLGFLYIPFPNIQARVEAVKIHDIHHLVTEYKANWKGETEIGAWEIASGCGRYTVAWLLNFGSFLVGMFLYPRALLAAFLRGRKCVTNLYFQTTYDEALLNQTLGELRKKIGIDSSTNYSKLDYLSFGVWCFAILVYYLLIALILTAGIWYLAKSLHFVV